MSNRNGSCAEHTVAVVTNLGGIEPLLSWARPAVR